MATVTTPVGSSAATYERLDIVTKDGGSYMALKAVPAGTAVTSSSYWMLIAEKGEPGASWDEGGVHGVVPIANGGTGATTASAARTNLGVVSKSGDTMTGQLILDKTSLQINPSATTNYDIFRIATTEGAARLVQYKNSIYESFALPTHSSDSSKTYSLLTSKNVVTKAQGGTGNADGEATLATTTEASSSAGIYPVGVQSSNTSKLYRDTSITMTGGTITATTFNGNATSATTATTATSATTATKLATARAFSAKFQANATPTSTNFDGSANCQIIVQGTVPITQGGTGATTAANARTALGAYSASGGTISGNATVTGNVIIGGADSSSALYIKDPATTVSFRDENNSTVFALIRGANAGSVRSQNVTTNNYYTAYFPVPEASESNSNKYFPFMTKGTSDLTAGTSALGTNCIHLVYE